MRAFIFSLFLILTPLLATQAQTLTGTVYSQANKQPVSEANVYLDGTSIHTITDKNGYFELTTDKPINTKLVISHIAYNIVLIDNPFKKIPSKIYLTDKTQVLNESVVISNRFTRKQKLAAFKQQFLGDTKAGKACVILNEDDIQVFYDENTQTLSATANNPIVIQNNYSAYKLQFGLVDFSVQYVDKTLNNKSVKQSFFLGTSSFIDLRANDTKIKKRRDEIYRTSSVYFFKNLANQTLKESNYLIFNGSYQVSPHMYFIIKDTLTQKQIQIDPDTNIDKFVLGLKKPIFGKISVMYNKKLQSAIVFLTDKILVDQYGNIDTVDKVLFSGHMGQQRIGNMLPLDYELDNPN